MIHPAPEQLHFFDQPVEAYALTIGGTITHVYAQPARIFTTPGEHVTLIVRGVVTATQQAPGSHEGQVAWTSRLGVHEAFELDSEQAQPILQELRRRTIEAADKRTAPAQHIGGAA